MPLMSEQITISNYFETVTGGINQIINKSINEINLLNEYRTRLFADVVTGKLNVQRLELPRKNKSDLQEYENEEFNNLGRARSGG